MYWHVIFFFHSEVFAGIIGITFYLLVTVARGSQLKFYKDMINLFVVLFVAMLSSQTATSNWIGIFTFCTYIIAYLR